MSQAKHKAKDESVITRTYLKEFTENLFFKNQGVKH